MNRLTTGCDFTCEILSNIGEECIVDVFLFLDIDPHGLFFNGIWIDLKKRYELHEGKKRENHEYELYSIELF